MAATDRRLYDLTPPQQAVYSSICFHGKPEVFNLSATLTIAGNVDPHVLDRTLNKLVEMNDALRIRLGGSWLHPRQYIVPYRYEPVRTIDLSRTAPEHVEEALIRVGRQPLFGFHQKLYEFSLVDYGDHHGCYLKVSHIIADGFSLVLLGRQLEETCRALISSAPVRPRASYVDFIERQQAYLSSRSYRTDRAYWEQEFAEGAEVTHIKSLFGAHTPGGTLEAAREKVAFTEEATQRVYDFCARNRLSVFSMLMGVTGMYLARISGRDRVTIGTLILNRTRGERQTVGMFVSLFPLPLRMLPRGSFIDNVHSVHRRVTQTLRHSRFPSEDALAVFRARHGAAALPYDVAMSFHTASFAKTDKTLDYEAGWLFNGYETNSLLLSIGDRSAEGHLVIEADYRHSNIDRGRVERVLGGIQALLADGMVRPEKPISELELVSGDERRELIHELNHRREHEGPPPKTLPELFEEQVARSPRRLAVVSHGVRMRYAEIDDQANQLARRLRELDVGPDVPVAVMVEPSIEMVVSLLAVLKAGGCYVPIDPGHPEPRVAFILADCGVKLVLAQRPVRSAPAGIRTIRMEMPDGKPCVSSPADPGGVSTPEDLAYIMYTSGSTGRPKGVAVPHRSLVTRLLCMKRDYNVDDSDVFILKTDFMFDVSITEVFLPLICGARLVIPASGTRRDPALLARHLADFGVTVVNFVPSMLAVFLDFLERGAKQLESLRHVFCAGEVLSSEQVRRAKRLLGHSVKIANQYGPTETSYASACVDVGGDEPVPIGKPMDHTTFYILDKHRKLLPRGLRGEIYIGGAGLARGYVSNEALTRERFIESPFAPDEILYRTGDHGRWMADGNIEFLGREDNQVKVRGFRVELGEVERALTRHPAVAQAVVLMRAGQVAAYIRSVESVDAPALRRFLGGLLPDWMIPSDFVFLGRMPVMRNGKVDRQALLRLACTAEPARTMSKCVTAAEVRLRDLWHETLGEKPIGAEDDFFEVGGDSLKAVWLALAIQDAFHVEVPVGEIYRLRTVREQASFVERQRTSAREGVVLLRRGTREDSTVFFVHGGSGSVGGYATMFREGSPSLPEEFTVYAIRYDRMDSCAPVEERIESVAMDYVARIRRVQEDGVYNLAAWCIGAQIITEIALLLETKGLEVARLIFFNSIAPREWDDVEGITLAGEKRFGSLLMADERGDVLAGAGSVAEVWERVLEYAEARPGVVRSRIPKDCLASIPNVERLGIGEVLYHLNCMRGLHAARAAYTPGGVVTARCFFVNPVRDRTIPAHLKPENIRAWGRYFERPINVVDVSGDEHSIFGDDVDDTVRAISSALRAP
jgi:amino acid adenylation domain-containing protein